MNENTESRYELATPLTFGVAFGFLVSPIGSPVVAMAAFVIGAGLGFWFDKTQSTPTKIEDEAPRECSAKKSACH